jgi:hypothetical protein
VKTLNGVLEFSSLKEAKAEGRGIISQFECTMSCCDLARSCFKTTLGFGKGFPWSSVKTSLSGASGMAVLAGVKTFANTGSVLFSTALGAFSDRGLVEGAVSLTERTIRGVKGVLLCCPGSTNGVNWRVVQLLAEETGQLIYLRSWCPVSI